MHEKHNLEEELGLKGMAGEVDREEEASATPKTPKTPTAGGGGEQRQSISEKANAVSAAIRNRRHKIMGNVRVNKLRGLANKSKAHMEQAGEVTAESVLKAHNMAALIFQDSTLIEEVQPDTEDPSVVDRRYGEVVSTLPAGETFGEIAMLQGEGKHRCSVRAIEPVFLITVNREVYQDTIMKVEAITCLPLSRPIYFRHA
jgi:hypothetical protein